MHVSKRRLLLAATSLTLAAGLAVTPALAQANLLETIKQRGKILIGTDTGNPPFAYLNEQAERVGSDVETALLLGKDLGVEVEFVPTTMPNRIPFLLSKKVDIIVAAFSITPERQKVIDFSERMYDLTQVVAGPVGDKVEGFADLAGKTIAATRGTTQDQGLTRGIKEHKVSNVTIVRYEDDAAAMTAVATGQQRYFTAPPAMVAALKKAHPSLDLEIKFTTRKDPLGVGLRKNEPELKAWLDQWATTNAGNGKLQEIFDRYHGGL